MSNKKGQYATTHQPLNKKLAVASYQFQDTSTTPNKLPGVGQYFRAIGFNLNPIREPLKSADCPLCYFKDSFLVRPDSGAFRCTACGAHGNGLVQLHAQLHGITCEQAREQLAAWVEALV